MKLFESKYFDEEDKKMHAFFASQVNKHIQEVISHMLNELGETPSDEDMKGIEECAKALTLKSMPARFQLMKMYFIQCRVVGLLREEAEKAPENDLIRMRHDAEESTRWALRRYIDDSSMGDETPECDCAGCQERRAREEIMGNDGLAGYMPKMEPCDEVARAFVMPMDDLGKGVTSDALTAPVTHAFRCTGCQAIQYNEEPCICGERTFGPIVIVDLPTEQMDAMNKMREAEKAHHAMPQADKKVVH